MSAREAVDEVLNWKLDPEVVGEMLGFDATDLFAHILKESDPNFAVLVRELLGGRSTEAEFIFAAEGFAMFCAGILYGRGKVADE